MKEIVLEKKNIIYGFVDTPKGYEVDLNTLKGSALYYFFIEKKRISDDPTNVNYNDFYIDYLNETDYFLNLIRERFYIHYKKTLILSKRWTNILYPGDSAILRNNLNIGNLEKSPDYTMVYGLDIQKNSCDLIIEWETNRKYNLNWTIPMENNKFIIFPSGLNYRFNKNISQNLNIIFSAAYSEV